MTSYNVGDVLSDKYGNILEIVAFEEGIYDLALCDTKGNIPYSFFKDQIPMFAAGFEGHGIKHWSKGND